MDEIRLKTSDTLVFESANCSDCIHAYDIDADPCFILGQLAYDGKSQMLYHSKDKSVHCRMKQRIITTSSNIIEWIDTARTEEIAPIFNKIRQSYHYELIRKVQVI